MLKRVPKNTDKELKEYLGHLDGGSLPDSLEPWKTFYDRTTQLHIDTDRGMYQLITVFVGASVLVLGWVAGSPQFALISRDHIAVVGSLAVVLVGVATLLKHRLRYYNKLREIYLRRLEEKLCGGATHLTNKPENAQRETDTHPLKSKPPLQGPQGFMESGAPPAWFEASFHEVIDIYYFVYLFVWFVLYMSRAC